MTVSRWFMLFTLETVGCCRGYGWSWPNARVNFVTDWFNKIPEKRETMLQTLLTRRGKGRRHNHLH